jgi:DNA-binding NarL/FixJ family response regulator
MSTVLVIDDDPLIADIIQALDPIWHVLSARDGLIGLDMLRHRVAAGHPPDLIILDIHMPGFDGYDTCILIRAVAPTVPIVPFTQARDDHCLPRYMQELSCSLPVLKGIELDALLQRLRTAMQSAPVTMRTTTAVLERLLQKATEAEQRARTLRSSRIPIALFAPSVVQRRPSRMYIKTTSSNGCPTRCCNLAM